jgi:hypothetical protein
MHFGNLSGIYSDILYCHNLAFFLASNSGFHFGILSGTLSGNYFDILSDMGTARSFYLTFS